MERKRSQAVKNGIVLLAVLSLSVSCLSTGPGPEETEAAPTTPAQPPTQEPVYQPPPSSEVVRPEDIQYIGAFRLPGDGDRRKRDDLLSGR